jgi:hypothetical protein
MKITMNIKITSLGLAGLLLATACSNDETQLIECGNEISFNTHVSRATETTTANLKNFKVWANATGFSSQRFIDGLIASKPDGKNYFTFENAVFWPQDVATLDVFAVSPASLTASVNANGPTVSNFTPATAAKDQADLVVAYSQANRSDGTNISLKFNHALSQIEVNATGGVTGVSETKHVWIKGAWLMNVCSSGTLAFDKDKATENYMNWSVGSVKTKYGIEFTSVQALDHTSSPLLASGFESSNMLLVPQQLATWNLDDESDKIANASKGAYILVLCRVEARHPGKEHPGADGAVIVDGDNHVHQLFPYTGKFDEEEYGYSCVPINTKWEPGKKYVYNLSFCGATSGAGVYPPTSDLAGLPDGDGKYIKVIPADKKVGDPVLDNPITFTVEVATWEGDENANVVEDNKNMN